MGLFVLRPVLVEAAKFDGTGESIDNIRQIMKGCHEDWKCRYDISEDKLVINDTIPGYPKVMSKGMIIFREEKDTIPTVMREYEFNERYAPVLITPNRNLFSLWLRRFIKF